MCCENSVDSFGRAVLPQRTRQPQILVSAFRLRGRLIAAGSTLSESNGFHEYHHHDHPPAAAEKTLPDEKLLPL
jgi:hypothetical protein